MPEPGVVLVGLPGSGKTTVGRMVAERIGRQLIDTDVLAERRAGMPVPEYLRRHGEAAFRAIESEAVADAVRQPGAVIATGGGAVIDPLNRWALWHHGRVAWLVVEPSVLAARLEADPLPRPMFQPYDPDRVAAFLDARTAFYRAADVHLDGSRPPATIADDLLRRLTGATGRRLFDAEVRRHHPIGPVRARIVLGVDLEPLGEAPVAVVDRRLLRAAPALVARIGPGHCLAVAGGERAKGFRQLERVLDWLAAERIERGTELMAVGGGTVGDLAGTAAALYARGLPLVQVPTTWLAQADSAIGGKVAIDLGTTKNMAGAFWPPVAVMSDVGALRSLPLRHRRDGMAESIKSAIIGDPALWNLLERGGRSALHNDEAARYAMIERSARLKLDVCDRDPFESGERRTLNLGHTLGHAIEAASGYRLPHGASVVLGLRAVASIAAGRGADADFAQRLDSLLDTLGFRLRHAFDPAAVRDALSADKKRSAGRQRWILPMAIGEVIEVDDVTDDELSRAMRTIAA